ncbi:MAG: helicase HerA-like domain-containing protein [Xanthomonadales bacterium]|nr:helicase HerA-like domain-containing protein [Xanthomonadales bacterium]
MQINKGTYIGNLIDTTGEQFIARLISDEDGYAPIKDIATDKVRVGEVGSYMLVKQSGSEILCVVDRMWEEGAEHNLERKVSLNPVGEVTAGGFQRGIRQFPTVGAELHLVTAWTLEKVFSEHSENEYKVGKLSANDSIDVYIDSANFFGRHVAILGQTGSGKSWTVTSLIQSALREMPNAHIILMDMHGEYGDKKYGMAANSPFPRDKVRCMSAADLEIPYWLLSYSELVELFINPEDEYAALQIAFLRSTMIRLKHEANSGYNVGHITVDSPVYFSLKELIKEFRDANERTSDFGKKKSATHGKFDQFLVRIESLVNDERYAFMFNPKKRTSTETMTGLMKDFVGLGDQKAAITVLDLSAVPFDIAPMVTAQVGRLAFEFNFWNPKCHDFPIFLICEEAHEYIPRSDNPRYKEARRSLERISKAGRKYGVGLCVVSQRPHELSETVLAQCGTFICLRISNPDDQEYVRALVPDAARGTFAALTSLSRGEVIIMGDAVPMPVRCQIDRPNPPPNAQDIDYGEKWKRGVEDVSVEELVRRWHTQDR